MKKCYLSESKKITARKRKKRYRKNDRKTLESHYSLLGISLLESVS